METISFFDPMTLEDIVLELNGKKFESDAFLRTLALSDLENELLAMKKSGLLKKTGRGTDALWLRKTGKRRFFASFFRILK